MDLSSHGTMWWQVLSIEIKFLETTCIRRSKSGGGCPAATAEVRWQQQRRRRSEGGDGGGPAAEEVWRRRWRWRSGGDGDGDTWELIVNEENRYLFNLIRICILPNIPLMKLHLK